MGAQFVTLAINPGNTSTKVGVFSGETPLKISSVSHDDKIIKGFPSVIAQKTYRIDLIRGMLSGAGIRLDELSCCVGRGGLLRPLQSGTYRVNGRMLSELAAASRGEHASNLGAVIAHDIASPLGIPAFIVDPVCVDEMNDVARLSGLSGIERDSLSHALNQKAVAKRHARAAGRSYSDMRLVVAHLGSGISICAHAGGRMIDVANPKEEGPFSPDRAGGLPVLKLAKLCFSGEYTEYKALEKRLFGGGGMLSYLGTSDLRKVMEMIDGGDPRAKMVFDAMVYQTAKYIGAFATVLDGHLDAILLTGGMAHEPRLVEAVKAKVGFIAPVAVYPGEDELQALCEGALRVLQGEETALEY
ncbi:MAG: butyrate kinase [Myxococcota bacterium]|jgi:butyrate kinase